MHARAQGIISYDWSNQIRNLIMMIVLATWQNESFKLTLLDGGPTGEDEINFETPLLGTPPYYKV